MATRIERERDFHDERFSAADHRPADAFYAVSRSSFAHYEAELRRLAPGTRVLEYGCGSTSYAPYLARLGARVTGIDISEVAVEQSRAVARAEGLEDRLDFRVMNAEALAFDDRFDLICGTGILHHLDLDRAYRQVAGNLEPSGLAIFLEPLGHNPLINLYRRITPEQRSADEHPLRVADIHDSRRFFGQVDTRCFQLASLLAMAARGRRRFDSLLDLLDGLDRGLFSALPALRRWAWVVAIRLEAPKAAPA